MSNSSATTGRDRDGLAHSSIFCRSSGRAGEAARCKWFFCGDSDNPLTRGFTLIELLVVLGIMAIMASLFLANFAGTRDDRNLLLAQSQLVTNIRSAQSYTLSARQIATNQNGQFFVLKFDNLSPFQYSLGALYNITATPTLVSNFETYQLPPGVRLSASNPVTIYRPTGITPPTTTPSCALLGFKAPYAKIYMNGDFSGDVTGDANGSCHFTSPSLATDDYGHILQYVTNVANYPVTTDSSMVITLTNADGTKFRKVMVRGVTGVVCPTQDNSTCSSN